MFDADDLSPEIAEQLLDGIAQSPKPLSDILAAARHRVHAERHPGLAAALAAFRKAHGQVQC